MESEKNIILRISKMYSVFFSKTHRNENNP
jgi:hypothetical protein